MDTTNLRLTFSIDEAAKQANVCRDKIYEAIRSGELSCRKNGRWSIVLADDLRRYLDSLPPLTLPKT